MYDKALEAGIIKGGFENDLDEVYRKQFSGVQATYLNRVFYLLSASMGTMSTRTMTLLLNKTVRRLKLGYVLYAVLSVKYTRPLALISEAVKDIKKGKFNRIKRWFIRKIPMLRPHEGIL